MWVDLQQNVLYRCLQWLFSLFHTGCKQVQLPRDQGVGTILSELPKKHTWSANFDGTEMLNRTPSLPCLHVPCIPFLQLSNRHNRHIDLLACSSHIEERM